PREGRRPGVFDAGIIERGVSWLAPPRTCPGPAAAESASRPPNPADHAKYDEKRQQELHGKRHSRPSFKHPRYSRLDSMPTAATGCFIKVNRDRRYSPARPKAMI